MKLEKGKIYDFTVVEKALDKKSVFIQDEFGNKHYYPRLFEIGIKIKLKILNIDETRKCFFQELRDYSKYKVSEIYEFDVIELVSKNKDNYYFKVIDSESKLISTVKAFKSQLPPNKIPQKLMCKVIEIDTANDRFIIHQFDSMPFQTIFEDGEFFDFKYIEISDSDPDYIIVKGIDGKLHSLLKPFGTNVSILKENDIIKYVCKHELGIVKFRYFITFEDIIKYRILKQNTFDALKNSNSPLAIKLYTDFNSKSNLWILSFCKLLQDEYRDCIEKDEYEKALMYGEVLVEIENWIINSGFITSFNSNIEEKMNYAISTYERYVIFTKALDIFLAKRFFHYFDNFCSEISSTSEFNYNISNKLQITNYILYLLKDQIKSEKVIELLIKLLENLGQNRYFKNYESEKSLKSLFFTLKNVATNLEKDLLTKIFLNNSAINEYYNKNIIVKQHLDLLRINILILKDYNSIKELNLNILKYLRTLSLYVDNIALQKSYIETALKFSNINFEDQNSQLLIDWGCDNFDNLLMEYVAQLPLIKIKKAGTLKQLFQKEEKIEGIILNEDRCGYVVDILGNKAILPVNWVADEKELDFNINPDRKIFININRIDEDFSRILISNNLRLYNISKQQQIEIGSIVEGVIKKFESYGAFVDLGSVDGLIHLSDLSYNHISHPSELLKIGERVKLKVIDYKVVENKTQVALSYKETRKVLVDRIKIDTICLARITKVNHNYITVEIIETGESGTILREHFSFDNALDVENFYSVGEKIRVQCIDIIEKKLFLSIKNTLTNIYSRNIKTDECYSGIIYEIENDLITIKTNELGQFVQYTKGGIKSKSLEKYDTVKFEVSEIKKDSSEIFVDIDFSSINKYKIDYVADNIDAKINEEIAKCYELYAMQKEDIDTKHNYLNWAKTFFSFSYSAKSYYLNFIITYQEIIKLSHIDLSTEINIHELIESVIEKSFLMINEIDSKELTTQMFPLLEQLKVTLKILCLFGAECKDSMDFLLNIVRCDNHSYIANFQLAKIVLSYNLISSEIKDIHLMKENWLIIHNILEEGLLNLDSLPIIDEKANELLKLIIQDESRTLEFKSSLMTPIPDKNKRIIIDNLNIDLKIAEENCNLDKYNKILSKIEDLQNNKAKKAVIHSAMKTLVAFVNSEGGDLVIGLEDDKNIIGLEFDFKSSIRKKENQFDGFNLDFDELIKEYIGTDFNLLFNDKAQFIEIDNKYLYWVKVKKSKSPVYLKKDDQGNLVSEVYIRAQGSSIKITKAEELQKFFKQFD